MNTQPTQAPCGTCRRDGWLNVRAECFDCAIGRLPRHTAPAVGLTGKGRAVALLIAVRDRWEQLTPDQRAEVSELICRLSVALQRDFLTESGKKSTPRPLPLVGRLSA